jgi:hypothetical protein
MVARPLHALVVHHEHRDPRAILAAVEFLRGSGHTFGDGCVVLMSEICCSVHGNMTGT